MFTFKQIVYTRVKALYVSTYTCFYSGVITNCICGESYLHAWYAYVSIFQYNICESLTALNSFCKVYNNKTGKGHILLLKVLQCVHILNAYGL